ncbi:MAG: hypothetical protein AAGB23_09550 [Pseudomonadota bacterium]
MSLQSGSFSGKSGFWVQWQDLLEFGDQLPSSPARLSERISCDWGFDTLEKDDLVLSLSIEEIGGLGELSVSVELADHNAPFNRLRASFRATYASLDLFKRDLLKHIAHEGEAAELVGRETT